jgi:hypothetical protein
LPTGCTGNISRLCLTRLSPARLELFENCCTAGIYERYVRARRYRSELNPR